MIHELKIWPEFFKPVLTGEKTFEIRKDDRGYRAGDVLVLKEWTKQYGYSGREITVQVTYLLSGSPWTLPGYVVMSIKEVGGKGNDTRTRKEGD